MSSRSKGGAAPLQELKGQDAERVSLTSRAKLSQHAGRTQPHGWHTLPTHMKAALPSSEGLFEHGMIKPGPCWCHSPLSRAPSAQKLKSRFLTVILPYPGGSSCTLSPRTPCPATLSLFRQQENTSPLPRPLHTVPVTGLDNSPASAWLIPTHRPVSAR